MYPSRAKAIPLRSDRAERARSTRRGFLIANAVIALLTVVVLNVADSAAPWLLGGWTLMIIACLMGYPELRSDTDRNAALDI